MTGAITFEFAATLAVAVGAVLGLWLHITRKIDAVKGDVALLKLEVIQNYASVKHLDKVEGKLIGAIDRLIDEVAQMNKAFTKLQISNAGVGLFTSGVVPEPGRPGRRRSSKPSS